MRKLGVVTESLEKVLQEMTGDHELQKFEVLSLVSAWIDCHSPDSIETYEDGTNPVFLYGHRDVFGRID